MLQLIEDRIRRGVPKPKRAGDARRDEEEEENTPKKKEEVTVPPSPYRANVAMKVRENTAMLALKQRILGKEGSMLLDYRTAQSAGTFDPKSNFQDETGRFLPRKHSAKNIMGAYDGSEALNRGDELDVFDPEAESVYALGPRGSGAEQDVAYQPRRVYRNNEDDNTIADMEETGKDRIGQALSFTAMISPAQREATGWPSSPREGSETLPDTKRIYARGQTEKDFAYTKNALSPTKSFRGIVNGTLDPEVYPAADEFDIPSLGKSTSTSNVSLIRTHSSQVVTGIYKGSSEERKKKGGMVDAKESTIFEDTSFDDEFFRLRGKEPTDPLSLISYSEREVKRGAAKAKQNAYEPMKSYRDSIVEKNRTMESRHDNRIFRGESSREISDRALGRSHPALQGHDLEDTLDKVTFHGLTETKIYKEKETALSNFSREKLISNTIGPYMNAAHGSTHEQRHELNPNGRYQRGSSSRTLITGAGTTAGNTLRTTTIDSATKGMVGYLGSAKGLIAPSAGEEPSLYNHLPDPNAPLTPKTAGSSFFSSWGSGVSSDTKSIPASSDRNQSVYTEEKGKPRTDGVRQSMGQDKDKPGFFGSIGSSLISMGSNVNMKREAEAEKIKMDAYGYIKPEGAGHFKSSQNLKDLERGSSSSEASSYKLPAGSPQAALLKKHSMVSFNLDKNTTSSVNDSPAKSYKGSSPSSLLEHRPANVAGLSVNISSPSPDSDADQELDEYGIPMIYNYSPMSSPVHTDRNRSHSHSPMHSKDTSSSNFHKELNASFHVPSLNSTPGGAKNTATPLQGIIKKCSVYDLINVETGFGISWSGFTAAKNDPFVQFEWNGWTGKTEQVDDAGASAHWDKLSISFKCDENSLSSTETSKMTCTVFDHNSVTSHVFIGGATIDLSNLMYDMDNDVEFEMKLMTKKNEKAGHLKVTIRLEIDEQALLDLQNSPGYSTETNPVLANAMYHVDQSMVRTDNAMGVQRALDRLRSVRSMREMNRDLDDETPMDSNRQSGGSSSNAPLRKSSGLMSMALAEEAAKLEPQYQTSARMNTQAGQEYIDTTRAVWKGKDTLSAAKVEKMKAVGPTFVKKKTAQDRLWRRLRKRYDDNDNIGDGDYGDDVEDFGDIEGSGGSDGDMVAAIPSVWQEFYDDSAQAKYWYNAATGEASWVQPEEQKQQQDSGSLSSSPTNKGRSTSRSDMGTARSARQKLETESPLQQSEMSSSRRQLRQQKILRKDPITASLVDVYACPELGAPEEEWVKPADE